MSPSRRRWIGRRRSRSPTPICAPISTRTNPTSRPVDAHGCLSSTFRDAITPDTAAARARAARLRDEIEKGAKFEDVAKRESADTVSGAQGGSLGRGGKNRFATEFEKAAYALKVGEVSQPVLTPFGYHLIRVDNTKATRSPSAISW